MSSISDLPAGVASQGLLQSRTDQLLGSVARAKPADSKLKSSAHQFEAILIGKWLEEAETTFAKLPGDDDDPDADPGQDQFRSMAIQFLAEGISSAGGLGVAAMILKHLEQPVNGKEKVDNKEVIGGTAGATGSASTKDY
jgi:Rod binding domain-containing protein